MSRRQEINSDRDRNFLGDTDGKFLLEDRKSTRHVSGAVVEKCKSDRLGNGFSPGFYYSMIPSENWSTKDVSGDGDGNWRVFCQKKKQVSR